MKIKDTLSEMALNKKKALIITISNNRDFHGTIVELFDDCVEMEINSVKNYIVLDHIVAIREVL